jgi:hypothetical protein
MIATSVELGSFWSDATGSTKGGIVGFPLKQDESDISLMLPV